MSRPPEATRTVCHRPRPGPNRAPAPAPDTRTDRRGPDALRIIIIAVNITRVDRRQISSGLGADRDTATRIGGGTVTQGHESGRRRRGFTRGHRLNRVLVATALLVSVFQLFALPLWLLPTDPRWAWSVLPVILMSTPFWSLIHEAIHGCLFPARAWNDRCGRVLGVFFGASFTMLKIGHLLHHRYSRTARDQSELFDPDTTTWSRFAPGYFARLMGGLYLAEFFGVLLAVLPASLIARFGSRTDTPDTVAGMLLVRLSRQSTLSRFRVDAAWQIMVWTGGFIAYGQWFWLLVIAVTGRALLVSAADNAYHYGTPMDQPLFALNLRLPLPLARFALHFNLHGTHHRNPGVEWFHLPARFTADREVHDLGWFVAVGRQFRGPVAKDSRPD